MVILQGDLVFVLCFLVAQEGKCHVHEGPHCHSGIHGVPAYLCTCKEYLVEETSQIILLFEHSLLL